jgi:ketosteroid isomerase-like protein
MPTADTVERFIARVEQNAYVEAIAEFYTPNASMQENQSPPRVGRDTLVAHERQVLANVREVTSTCMRPVFVQGDRVVIRWVFRFEFLDGSTMQMEELAYQRWEGEQIAEERFFYDPAQTVPKSPTRIATQV